MRKSLLPRIIFIHLNDGKAIIHLRTYAVTYRFTHIVITHLEAIRDNYIEYHVGVRRSLDSAEIMHCNVLVNIVKDGEYICLE